jgi:hypothetical protein
MADQFDNVVLESRAKWLVVKAMQLKSTLTCPNCGFQATEQMPLDACQFFYECKGCGEKLKPKAGDCCVFCSYGSVPCPPVQQDGGRTCCSEPRLTAPK